MAMFKKEIYIQRRQQLKQDIAKGIILLMGNHEVGMNYADNCFPFRQDSCFLYFLGLNRPGLAGVLDAEEGIEMLFGTEPTIDDIVWMGTQPSLASLGEQTGMSLVKPFSELEGFVKKAIAAGRTVHFLPPYRPDNRMTIATIFNLPPAEVSQQASASLLKAIVSQRAVKSPEEIIEITKSVNISNQMQLAAMQHTVSGVTENYVAGKILDVAISAGGNIAYPTIFTVNGQTLHNHPTDRVLKNGDLVLCDCGAENSMYYAGDLTRTYPVNKKFSAVQKEIYEIVLGAEIAAAKALKPGVLFLDIHLAACEYIFDGLKQLGLVRGDTKEAVQQGAHALFFLCGLGHMMGLDVHDMEDLGEAYVGYTDTLKKSDQFGLKSLRLGRALEPGFVLTVEPGIYFIPELIDLWAVEKKHAPFINYDKLTAFRNFGGARVEENFFITRNGATLLGDPLVKNVEGIEAFMMGH